MIIFLHSYLICAVPLCSGCIHSGIILPRLIFANKTAAYSSVAILKCSTLRVGSRPDPEILEEAEKYLHSANALAYLFQASVNEDKKVLQHGHQLINCTGQWGFVFKEWETITAVKMHLHLRRLRRETHKKAIVALLSSLGLLGWCDTS
jgi:hypothetical protein